MSVEELTKTCWDKMSDTLKNLDSIPAKSSQLLAEKKTL